MDTEKELQLRLAIINAEIRLENARRERALVELQRERIALRMRLLTVNGRTGGNGGSNGGGLQCQESGECQQSSSDAIASAEEQHGEGISADELEGEDAGNEERTDEHDDDIVDVAGVNPSTDANLQVFVKTPMGRTIPITAGSHWDVQRLKTEIERVQELPSAYRLIAQGRQLEVNNSLGSYGIQDGSLIHLILTLRAC